MRIIKKDWESEYFSFNIGSIIYEPVHSIGDIEISLFKENLGKIVKDNHPFYEMLELNLNAGHIFLSPVIEDEGFRLCDSRMTFMTKIKKRNFESYKIELEPEFKLRLYQDSDLNQVLSLGSQHLVNDKKFVSKYKSSYFFKSGIAEKYFRTWLIHSLESGESIASVLEFQNEIIGFFIYKKNGTQENLDIYKGILTAVNEKYRGEDYHLLMQEFIFNQIISEEFFIDNTTQISNIPIIRNHFKSGRKPHSIHLTFLWKK